VLRIVNVEEIERLLLAVPGLVDRLERKDAELDLHAREWLVSLEAALQANRLPVASTIASLRCQIKAAQQGSVLPGIRISGRLTPRRAVRAVVAESLAAASSAVLETIAKDRSRIDEAERMMRQLVARGGSRGLVSVIPPDALDHGAKLGAAWRNLRDDEELGQVAIHVEGLVGPHDSLILLDRCSTADHGPEALPPGHRASLGTLTAPGAATQEA